MTIIPIADTISLDVTLLSPMHHGAGSSGNTAVLRTQEVIQPDGTMARVPFLSAASVRHALRDRIAWHLASTLAWGEGALTKPAVDLLWSGGAVTTTGAQVDLGMARRVEETFPALGLLGHAAQSDIVEGTLRASDLILVCEENEWRLPPGLTGGMRAAAYRTEEFGTRHDKGSSPVMRMVDAAGQLTGDTTQMIFDTQVLKAGSRLWGSLSLTPAATAAHRMALGAALALWAPGGETALGAKTASGYGRARIDGLPDTTADLAAWTAHITAHGDPIMELIRDLAS